MPPIERTLAWRRSGRHCFYCFILLTPETATRDHIVPKVDGGPNHQKHNIVIACRPCNHYKASMFMQDFLSTTWLKNRRNKVASGKNSPAPISRNQEEEQERERIGL